MPAFGNRSRRIVRAAAGQLATGARAAPGLVGYLGLSSALTTVNINDSVPGGWNAVWDTGALIVRADNVTIDHYRINAAVVFTGLNPTVSNSIVTANPGDFFVINQSGSGKGFLTVTDTTAIGQARISPALPQSDAISSDSGLIARRCEVYGSGDGIHPVPQPGSYATGSIVSQCYVHDLSFIDEDQHCDGIQYFSHETSPGFLTVEHCYIGRVVSTIGTPCNSALTGMPSSDTTSQLTTWTINNNYFANGLYHLRVGSRAPNTVITNNDFGPLEAQEFGLYDYLAQSDIDTWSNNRDYLGNQISFP